MKLFICHASEDKDDFVHPLAEALRHDHDVWYDKFALTLGDSLLRKINEGLASCDFGVVVLSHAFFRKKWPQDELDGLFARETASRKIILPIWKDITHDDVVQFSPILAGKLAVSAADGLKKVVAEINLAIQVSQRTRELSAVDSAIVKAKGRLLAVRQRQEGLRLLDSEKGAGLFMAHFESLSHTLERIMSELSNDSDGMRFRVKRNGVRPIYFHGPFRVGLCLNIKDICSNTARTATLHCIIYRSPDSFEDDRRADELLEMSFTPLIGPSKQFAWVAEGEGQEYSTEELAGRLIEALTEEVAKHANEE